MKIINQKIVLPGLVTKRSLLLRTLRSRRGFTLVELLIVIAVIGILISFALPQYNHFQLSGRDARRKSDLAEYHVALQRYYNQRGVYQVGGGSSNGLLDTSAPTPNGIFVNPNPLSTDGYLAQPILDPINSAPGGLYYRYLTDINGSSYILYAKLEAGTTTWWTHDSGGTAQGTNNEPTTP